jgi:hypothetical protein
MINIMFLSLPLQIFYCLLVVNLRSWITCKISDPANDISNGRVKPRMTAPRHAFERYPVKHTNRRPLLFA